jgi:hypothetical protein
MKTVNQVWKERGVDDDRPPPDEYINGWLDASEAYKAEINRLRAALAESCEDHRSNVYDTTTGGGCALLHGAEKEIERLRAALAAQLPLIPDMFWEAEYPETCSNEIMDIAAEYGPGEVIKLDCAMRLPSITVRVTKDGDDIGYEIVGGITGAKP